MESLLEHIMIFEEFQNSTNDKNVYEQKAKKQLNIDVSRNSMYPKWPGEGLIQASVAFFPNLYSCSHFLRYNKCNLKSVEIKYF